MKNINLFWAGLSVIAAKRFDRDLLLPGQYPLQFRIACKHSTERATEIVNGELLVAEQQQRTTTAKPSAEELVAAILYQLSPKKRAQVVEVLAARQLQANDECVVAAKQIVASNSSHSISAVRGSLAFSSV